MSDTFIKGIDHVAIVVSDMDRSLKFYNEVLGLVVLKDGRNEGGDKKSFLGTKNKSLVALTEDKNRATEDSEVIEGVSHIAFKVEDVEKAKNTLENKGVSFIEVKISDDGKTKAYHFLDPDGLELEIFGESTVSVPPY